MKQIAIIAVVFIMMLGQACTQPQQKEESNQKKTEEMEQISPKD